MKETERKDTKTEANKKDINEANTTNKMVKRRKKNVRIQQASKQTKA